MADEHIPSSEVCQELVERFADITGTDEALAQFFLQDRDWDLERSVKAFFDDAKSSEDVRALSDGDSPEVVVTFDSGVFGVVPGGTATTEPPPRFSILTWNLDGLEPRNLKKRTKAVAKIIEKERPDIVLLQEVIPVTYCYLEERLPLYMFIAAGSEDYFVATLLRRTTIYFDGQVIQPFPNSVMKRNILLVEGHIGSLKLRILNTHLESTAEFAKERMNQLRSAFQLLTSGPVDTVSFLGGDLNLRDKELADVSTPSNVVDVWEACGSRKECRYTWDLTRNTNKEVPGRFKPRCRFDRVYIHQKKPFVNPEFFGLLGLEKVAGTQSFPSDHWAIITFYKILSQNSPTLSGEHTAQSSLSVAEKSLKNLIFPSRPIKVSEHLHDVPLANADSAVHTVQDTAVVDDTSDEESDSVRSEGSGEKRCRDPSVITLDSDSESAEMCNVTDVVNLD